MPASDRVPGPAQVLGQVHFHLGGGLERHRIQVRVQFRQQADAVAFSGWKGIQAGRREEDETSGARRPGPGAAVARTQGLTVGLALERNPAGSAGCHSLFCRSGGLPPPIRRLQPLATWIPRSVRLPHTAAPPGRRVGRQTTQTTFLYLDSQSETKPRTLWGKR